MTKNYDLELILCQLSGAFEEDIINYGDYADSYCGPQYFFHKKDTREIKIDATLSYEEIVLLASAIKEIL